MLTVDDTFCTDWRTLTCEAIVTDNLIRMLRTRLTFSWHVGKRRNWGSAISRVLLFLQRRVTTYVLQRWSTLIQIESTGGLTVDVNCTFIEIGRKNLRLLSSTSRRMYICLICTSLIKSIYSHLANFLILSHLTLVDFFIRKLLFIAESDIIGYNSITRSPILSNVLLFGPPSRYHLIIPLKYLFFWLLSFCTVISARRFQLLIKLSQINLWPMIHGEQFRSTVWIQDSGHLAQRTYDCLKLIILTMHGTVLTLLALFILSYQIVSCAPEAKVVIAR